MGGKRPGGKKGGGGGKKGKGGGKGRKAGKRSKRRREREEEPSEEAVAAASEPEEPQEEELPPPKPKKQKPSYGALLSAFNVAVDSEDEDEDDSEDGAEEGESAEGDADMEGEEGEEEVDDEAEPAQRGAPGPKGGVQTGDDDDEDVVAGGVDTDEEAAADLAASDGEEDAEGPAVDAGAADKEKRGGSLNFYPNFWDEREGEDGATAAPSRIVQLPGLQRCELPKTEAAEAVLSAAKGDDKGEDAGTRWRQCTLSRGMYRRFVNWQENEKVQVGPQESSFLMFQHSYLDVSFPQHNHHNSRAVRATTALHVVDHVAKAREEVRANDLLMRGAKKQWELGEQAKEKKQEEAKPDKGFTAPRVLIVCPFRSVCYEYVHLFRKFYNTSSGVEEEERFEEQYAGEIEEVVAARKPADWRDLFDGNCDDKFKIGIKFGTKRMRLFASFMQSDVLICSPLGLRQLIGATGDNERYYDFLSSIEVCVIDRADVLRNQNWEHVQELLKVVNARPQHLGNTDISRLRAAFADGKAREFRQTIVTSNGQSMDAEALFQCGTEGVSGREAKRSKLAKLGKRGKGARGGSRFEVAGYEEDEDAGEDSDDNGLVSAAASRQQASGKRTLSCRGLARLVEAPPGDALRASMALGIAKQFFLHVDCQSVADQRKQLFAAFEKSYWKPLGSTLDRLLIVVPTYLGFLEMRKFLREQGASFCSIFEYADSKSIHLARTRFQDGEKKVLLVTERFQWYRRFKLRGADYVLFVGAPETAAIYEDVLSNVRTPSVCNSMCLFTRHDGFAVERIAGHERARRMLTSKPGKVFVYN